MAAELTNDWAVTDWTTKIESMKPSGDGKVGVVFVKVKNVEGYAFVIKPVGNASSVLMGETMATAIGGTQSLNSIAKPVASQSGAAIKQALTLFQQKEKEVKQKARWVNFMASVNALPYLLIQDFLTGAESMDYRTGAKLINLLSEESFVYGLGKLFAADAIMGNGDRLCSPNSGNIMFSRAADGKFLFYSVDTSTVLTNFNAVLNDQTTHTRAFLTMGEKNMSPLSWAKEFINPTGADRSRSLSGNSLPGAVPYPGEKATPVTFNLDTVFDYKNWWFTVFKRHFEKELKENAKHEYYIPSEKMWQKAFHHFQKGVKDGIEMIDIVLSRGYGWLKARFKLYKDCFGSDPNMDWMNLKIRRVYFQAHQKAFFNKYQKAVAAMELYVQAKSKKGTLNRYA